MYLHKSLREADEPPAPRSFQADAQPGPATLPLPPACHRVFEATWAMLLGHRQSIRAGVPGCTCGMTFNSHSTFVADHTHHLAEEVVREVLRLTVGVLEADQAADHAAAADLIRTVLAPVREPERIPA